MSPTLEPDEVEKLLRRIPLAQAVIYIATAPKSNAAYSAILAARKDVREGRVQEVPADLRVGSYKGAEELGRGQGSNREVQARIARQPGPHVSWASCTKTYSRRSASCRRGSGTGTGSASCRRRAGGIGPRAPPGGVHSRARAGSRFPPRRIDSTRR